MTPRPFHRPGSVGLCLAAALACFAALTPAQSAQLAAASALRPPNILFAIADDWGRHAGANGTKWVRTPTSTASRGRAESILAALLRWRHPGLAAIPATLLR